MTLKDCTKAELIFIVERMKLHLFSTGDYYLSMALMDVEQAREEKKLTDAEQISAYAYQKRQEYIDLMAPYDGKRLVDIPDSVLKKADAAMREAQEADRKWNKIMGISGGCRRH